MNTLVNPLDIPQSRQSIVWVVVMLSLLVVASCTDGNGIERYEVSGTLEIRNVNCEIVIPDSVRVHAELFRDEDRADEAGIFGSNGPFQLTFQWAGQAPEGWRVTRVTRTDGSEICTREQTCGDDRVCTDTVTKVRRSLINSEIDWRVSCSCQSGG